MAENIPPTPPPPPNPDAGVQPPAPPPDGAEPTPDGRGVKILSTGTYKKIKDEAAQRGRKRYQEELDKQARELGFESMSDLMLAARTTGVRQGRQERPSQRPARAAEAGPGPGAEPQPPRNRGDRREMDRYNKLHRQWEADRAAYRDRLAKAEAKVRMLQRERDAKDAEMALREIAVAEGVRDVDYAVRLCTRALEGKSDDELKAFDERKFFQDLRASKPYLYGVAEAPATTGTTGADGAAPPPQTPGAIQQRGAQAAQFDARKVKAEEYRERLAKLGLSVPTV